MSRSTLRSLANSRLGQRLKPIVRWSISRLLTTAGMVVRPGGQPIDPRKPTVLVVSHEASATGAPILALNLCQQLRDSHNVIVLLLRGGSLLPQFQASSAALIQARRQFVNRKLVQRALGRACEGQPVQFALVNSVVSAPLLEPLRGQGIACLCLVHEFVTYIKPLAIFSEVGLWASRVVCSTPLTWNDVLRHCPQLADVPVVVLPQGRCQLPASRPVSQQSLAPVPSPRTEAERFLKRLPADQLLVLGAGAVQPRKGVDLFVAVAQQIVAAAPELPVQFAWIGNGYAPDHDFSVSVWVKDQIERSGLGGRLTMLDESAAYADLVERSDLFLVSSRLDPLPNVAIDAMLAGTPVLCFAQACGIAGLLEQQPVLHDACVAPYFDIQGLARKAVRLLQSPQQRQQISQHTLQQARRWFEMPSYIRQLVQFGETSAEEVQQEQADISLLLEQRLINREFHSTDAGLSELAMTQRYLLAWRSNIHARKPFPGFHPGIYREQQLPAGSRRDPLAHWHLHGRPAGPWQVPVIEPSVAAPPVPEPGSVALHIHVFYPELLGPILGQLSQNRIRPDLYLSYSNPELESEIRRVLSEQGLNATLQTVPNRGRDLGPLLSELGAHLDRQYDFHGHLHTKKSVLIDGGTAARWREFLLINLLGDAQRPMADHILAAMQADPQVGLVFPDDPGCLGWTANRQEAEALASRLALPALPNAINFPVGTMFWARRGALTKLYELGLRWDDYPAEPIGYDGTMLHAIERMLPQVCLASGFGYAVTHVPGFSR